MGADQQKQMQPSISSETLELFAKRMLARLQSNWPDHPINDQIAKDLIHELRGIAVRYEREYCEKMVDTVIRDGAISDDKWAGFPRVRQMYDTAEALWKKRPQAIGWNNPLAEKTDVELAEMRKNYNELADQVEQMIKKRRMPLSE